MKKLLPTLLAIILSLIIFLGCGGDVPEGVDAINPGDTVVVSVGDTIYRSSSQWFRLVSIMEDTRIPEGYENAGSGRVKLNFQIYDHSVKPESTEILSSDTDMFFILDTFHFPSIDHATDFKFTVIEVLPYAMAEIECEQSDYHVTIVCEWYIPE
ncbi:MAG: hypothetical protein KAU44_01530 [Candidatus Marinimicrobia bacterium]|nr:hypothetical protein [Candidatus Neomarinimicrobiota bacterium]